MSCRRAKRLRKILRQLESPAARGPLTRFWRGTWGVVAALLLAHIICYAVLASILTVRHAYVGTQCYKQQAHQGSISIL